MRKTTIVLTLALLGSLSVKAQAWSENFNNGIPSTWTLYDVDGKTPYSSTSFVNNAWVSRIKTDSKGPIVGDSVATSTSWYNPAGQADDWLISPSFLVTTGMALTWESKSSDPDYPDGYEVRISTTGNAVSDFSTILYSITAENTDKYVPHYTSLSSYVGQTVRIAFRNNSNDKDLLMIDNVKAFVPPANDISLTDVTPADNSLISYVHTSSNVSFKATVFNYGTSTITGFTLKYMQGSNAAITNNITGVNIAPYTSYTFTCPNPYTTSATDGTYPFKLWAELAGDANQLNDSGTTTLITVSYFPQKKIFVEEGTGTWCGWCPRGAVYMDSIAHTNASNFSLAAVHNSDPMELTAYDTFLGNAIGGYPSIYVDRREVLDPSDLFDVYNNEKDYFGFADLTITDMGASSFDFSVKASVKPAIDMNGDYRLALVLTEDNVRGGPDGSDWDQNNYYSSTAANRPLNGAGHNWQQEPNPVLASNMSYNFVARMIMPGPTGAASSLPTTMTAGTTYDYTFPTFTIPQPYVRAKMKAIVILIRNSDGAVLNSQNITMPLGVSNIDAGVQHLSVYPNPSNNNTTIAFTLTEKSSVGVQVIDALGRVVNTVSDTSYEKGAQHINVNTTDMATGLYTIKLQTEKGTMTQQLSVVK